VNVVPRGIHITQPGAEVLRSQFGSAALRSSRELCACRHLRVACGTIHGLSVCFGDVLSTCLRRSALRVVQFGVREHFADFHLQGSRDATGCINTDSTLSFAAAHLHSENSVRGHTRSNSQFVLCQSARGAQICYLSQFSSQGLLTGALYHVYAN